MDIGVADFRAQTGAASLKRHVCRQRFPVLLNFRAQTGAASLKLLFRLQQQRAGLFPRPDGRGLIEAASPVHLGIRRGHFRAQTGAASLKPQARAGKAGAGFHFRAQTGAASLKPLRPWRAAPGTPNFRAQTGAASLKLPDAAERCGNHAHFRAQTGAASLKPVGLRTQAPTRGPFPRPDGRGLIEATAAPSP